MTYGLSNGHVTDDITWPPKVLWGSTVGYPSDSMASCTIPCQHAIACGILMLATPSEANRMFLLRMFVCTSPDGIKCIWASRVFCGVLDVVHCHYTIGLWQTWNSCAHSMLFPGTNLHKKQQANAFLKVNRHGQAALKRMPHSMTDPYVPLLS